MRRIRSLLSTHGAGEIVRRYWVINSFDGAIVTLGIILGLYAAGSLQASLVVRVILASGSAMFLSGFFGSYFAERAERSREIKEIEGAMLKKLDKSVLKEVSHRISLLVAVVDGISPLISSLIVVAPFFFASLIGITYAFYASIAVGMGLLFSLGCFLGKVSKTGMLLSGLKMVVVAILVVILMAVFKLV